MIFVSSKAYTKMKSLNQWKTYPYLKVLYLPKHKHKREINHFSGKRIYQVMRIFATRRDGVIAFMEEDSVTYSSASEIGLLINDSKF